jgi:DNA-directed RNA polymerase subunit RPC12/RpoP
MTELSFLCTKCGKEFDCDVGKISFPVEENRPRFEKDIVCPRCGVLTMAEVELTELGQTQLGAVFMAELE